MTFDEEAPAKPELVDLDKAPAQDNDSHPNQPPPLETQEGSDASDGEGDETCIPEDSFSMFYVADTWLSHAPPLIVYIMQMWILAIIVTQKAGDDWFGKEGGGAPLMVQIAACFISVFTSSDLVDGLLFIGKPIDHKGITMRQAGAKHSCKWEISNLMRFSEGLFAVCVSFLFILKSEDTVDLFLNFVGVAFVSEMDNGFYKLAAKGVFGKRAKESAAKVPEYSCKTKKKNGRIGKAFRCIILALLSFGMLITVIILAAADFMADIKTSGIDMEAGELR